MAIFDTLNPLENITPKFTEEQLNTILDFFDEKCKPLLIINEGEPTNVITIEQLIIFLGLKIFHRRSFHYPSYSEIMNEAEQLKAGVTRMLTKDQFIYILNKWVLEPSIKHELMLAFQIFDTEKRDFLEVDEIEAIVTEYGDVFTYEEVLEMKRDANVRGDGNVFYSDFVNSLFNLAPELHDLETKYLYEDPDEDPSVPPEPVIIEEEPPPPPPPPPPPAPSKKKKK